MTQQQVQTKGHNNVMRQIGRWSLATAIVFIVLVTISAFTGINQEEFEHVFEPQAYAASMLAKFTGLKVILFLDFLFIAGYTSVGLFLYQWLLQTSGRSKTNEVLSKFFLCALLIAAVLDILENAWLFTFLSWVKIGESLDIGSIGSLSVLSSVKWYFAYLAFFMVGLVLPATNFALGLFKGALLWIQMPVGLAALLFAGEPGGEIAYWLRYVNLGFGFLFFAWLPTYSAGRGSWPSRSPQAAGVGA